MSSGRVAVSIIRMPSVLSTRALQRCLVLPAGGRQQGPRLAPSARQQLSGPCRHLPAPKPSAFFVEAVRPLSPWWCRDGDVYIGSRWNELSVLYLIFLVTPLLGLLFAWATHGTLWDTGVYY